MLNQIIAFSLRNRPMVLFFSVLLLGIGTWTAWRMEVDVFPDLNAPTVVVMTEATGMAPEEVEQLVTFPIETAVNGATGVRRVRSSSTAGFSVVWVEFDWNTDVYRDRQIVSEKLVTLEGTLPPNVSNPIIGPQSSILGEVMFVGLTADSTSAGQLRTLADWTVRPALLSVGGVAQVTVMGGELQEYQVRLHPERMRHYGVSLTQVLAAVRGMNSNAAGGVLYEYGNEYIVRAALMTASTDEMAQAVVARNAQGQPVRLGDVADVIVGEKQPKMGTASVNGQPAVLLTVTKQPNTCTLEVTETLDKAVADLQQALPPDVKVNTHLYRQQDFIDSSISNIQKSLLEGGIFVVLVLFIFLMNARTTLISLVTIPLSLLVTIIVLQLMGLTLNTMSIGGMAIAIGSLVDDAIVDVENVYKRLRQNALLPEAQRLNPLKVIYDASREVRMPILNSTFIVVVSFVPLFCLSGLEGRMLAPLGVSFMVSLFASTLVALTLTPVLCSYLLGKGKMQEGNYPDPFWVRWLKNLPEFGEYVNAAVGGEVVSQVLDKGRAFDLTVRMSAHDLSTIDHIRQLLIDTPDGRKVPLSEVCEVVSTAGPNTISRENAQRKLVVSANVEGRDMRSVVTDMRRAIEEKIHLPEGYRVEYGGQFESEETASRLLLALSLVSIFVIYLLLYLQFRSAKQALVVLLSLPLALIGGVMALVVTGGVVSIPAIIGFISLFGIATRGGMLLVDRYNELARQGLSHQECVLQGSLDRLLPILMTALSSALALIPLALGSSLPGNEIQSPMAQVLLGGLLTSTLLIVIVVPVIFSRFNVFKKQHGAQPDKA